MTDIHLCIEPSWKNALSSEFNKPYIKELENFLLTEKEQGKVIFPKKENIFRAFNLTPIDKIKVIILGQDPYHGDNQANGLSFSVNENIALPPSLKNIYKELHDDLGCSIPQHGDLTSWAEQGVLLLNTVLTVQRSAANSHRDKGWEKFTTEVIKTINNQCKNVVFILWGSPAASKELLIDGSKHLILKAPHPSPLSSYRGFFGCKHFSLANNYLKNNNKKEINWQL